MQQGQDHRGIWGWMMFDWANQPFHTLIVTFIFAPYFASEVASDIVTGQAQWGWATAIAGGIAALFAPVLGAVADRTGYRKRWVALFSLPFILGSLGLWLAVPGTDATFFVLVCFGLAFIGSEYTFIFTNSMLPDLGARRDIGRISGTGWALGYVGGLISLILVFVFISPLPGKDVTLVGIAPAFGLDPGLGEPPRATGVLTALWFVIFAIPFFLWTPDATKGSHLGPAIHDGLADLRATLREARRHKTLFQYLVASMIYRDALAALFAFGGIYAAGVLGWSMFELGIFGIIAAATGALGAWLGGRCDAAFGPRRVILVSLLLLILICLMILFTDRSQVALIAVADGSRAPDIAFLIAGGLLGACSGSLQAASRTMLIDTAEGRVASAQAFGLYALSGKATAFIGPVLIAFVTSVTGSQKLGVSPVLGLFILGGVLLYCTTGRGRVGLTKE